MNEMVPVEAPAVDKPKRKYRRHKRPARAKAQSSPKAQSATPSDLLGLSPMECPAACSREGCVISGKRYCGHPRKGGLQGADLADPAAVDRSNRAKRALAHMMVDKRKD